MKAEFIEGPILIRPYRADDIEPLFTAARESVNELSRWLPWCHADYAEARLSRIEILAVVSNTASQRVAEKIGALREGVLRRRLLIQGQSQDAVIYSLVPEDLSMSDKL